MLIIKFLRKWFIKIRKWLGLFFFFYVILSVGANVTLSACREMAIQVISRDLTHNLSVDSIRGVLPNRIILKNVSFIPKPHINRTQSGNPVFIPKVVLRISIWRLLFHQTVSIFRADIVSPQVDAQAMGDFFFNNYAVLQAFMDNLPEGRLKLVFKKIQLDKILGEGSPLGLKGDLVVNLREKKRFSAAGCIRASLSGASNEERSFFRADGKAGAVQIAAKGSFRDSIQVDSLVLLNKKIYAKLWGESEDRALRAKGFMFLRGFSKQRQEGKEPFWAWKFVENIFDKDSRSVEEVISEQAEVYVLDIDSIIRFARPIVYIDHLYFTLNNAPVKLKGQVHLGRDVSGDLNVAVLPATLPGNKRKPFKKADIGFQFDSTGSHLEGQGDVEIYFGQDGAMESALNKIEMGFEGLSFYLDRSFHPAIHINQASVSFTTNQNPHILLFQDLDFNQVQSGHALGFDVTASIYEGSLTGVLEIDLESNPKLVSGQAQLRGVNANQLSDMLVHFAKVHGRLRSDFKFSTQPAPNLKGQINIEEGRLKDYDFFLWVVESFDLPSLQEVFFDDAAMGFVVDSQKAGLYDIRLDSRDVRITGDFQVSRQNLVTSKLALVFKRDLLQESRKFRAVLKQFDANLPSLEFDFQLSGSFDAMNFQWLPNEVKEKIQAMIPNFIERRIDRKVEENFLIEEEAPLSTQLKI